MGPLWARFGTAAVLAVAGAAASCAAASSTRHHRLEMRNAAFQPATLDVAAGDTVTWVNRDIVPHTVSAADGAWDSGEVGPGQAFVLVVERAETTSYLCQYHPTMVGRLEAP